MTTFRPFKRWEDWFLRLFFNWIILAGYSANISVFPAGLLQGEPWHFPSLFWRQPTPGGGWVRESRHLPAGPPEERRLARPRPSLRDSLCGARWGCRYENFQDESSTSGGFNLPHYHQFHQTSPLHCRSWPRTLWQSQWTRWCSTGCPTPPSPWPTWRTRTTPPGCWLRPPWETSLARRTCMKSWARERAYRAVCRWRTGELSWAKTELDHIRRSPIHFLHRLILLYPKFGPTYPFEAIQKLVWVTLRLSLLSPIVIIRFSSAKTELGNIRRSQIHFLHRQTLL